ncbi:hypothetical protein E6O75_ATG06404 [Venturia nashicola]|uniref:Uncharacterized protein n=1 Tax=Venturia nashicola TaxID=86259 RepID=A0A4Z1PBH2_9PEZI|nr:hypothetical protein E6O75_ATG06404 [Venturia nashicola]
MHGTILGLPATPYLRMKPLDEKIVNRTRGHIQADIPTHSSVPSQSRLNHNKPQSRTAPEPQIYQQKNTSIPKINTNQILPSPSLKCNQHLRLP